MNCLSQSCTAQSPTEHCMIKGHCQTNKTIPSKHFLYHRSHMLRVSCHICSAHHERHQVVEDMCEHGHTHCISSELAHLPLATQRPNGFHREALEPELFCYCHAPSVRGYPKPMWSGVCQCWAALQHGGHEAGRCINIQSPSVIKVGATIMTGVPPPLQISACLCSCNRWCGMWRSFDRIQEG